MYEEYRTGSITMDDRTTYMTIPSEVSSRSIINSSTTNPYQTVTITGSINDYDDKIKEIKDMISQLSSKPYYMKIQCHNCGAPLTIESENHLVKCRYCHTAYFSGTQLINSYK